MNNILALIIFWTIGIVIALLGNKKIREYKDYDHPKLFFDTRYIVVCLYVVGTCDSYDNQRRVFTTR